MIPLCFRDFTSDKLQSGSVGLAFIKRWGTQVDATSTTFEFTFTRKETDSNAPSAFFKVNHNAVSREEIHFQTSYLF